MNIPNQITLTRLILAGVLFVVLERIGGHGYGSNWYFAFGLYFLTAGTDWLDGFLARRWGQVTALGRIIDPLADKIVIAGVMVLCLTYPETTKLVPSWLVLLVISREFLVSGLRAFVEGQGHPFAAGWSGKSKFLLQAVYCGAVLFYPGDQYEWVRLTAIVTMWGTAILTVVSAGIYVGRAVRLLRSSGA
ncbi:MAG: CDP-diacylglycerol--glycerol-3-phosphate 3-phosphatidyltransferase [Planctomycetota bacterium]